MNKKSFIILIMVIIVILFGVLIADNAIFSQQVKIGNADFSIPPEYQKQNVSENLIQFTNGDDVFFINGDVNSTDIDTAVSRYVDFKNNSENMTVKVKEINDNGLIIYKSVVEEDPGIVHYWFTKENHIYEIYTSTANQNTDKFIFEIIKS